MPHDTTREERNKTLHQARNTTIAGMLSDQATIITATPAQALSGDTPYDLWVVNTTSASVTIELPPLADVEVGRAFTFYKTVAANSMIIEGNGSEQIEGAANLTRTARYAMIQVKKIETAAGTGAWLYDKAAGSSGDLVAANNLSDIGDAATALGNLGGLAITENLADLDDAAEARGNLGVENWVPFAGLNLVGATADSFYYVHPTGAPDATIESIDTRLSGALTTGNAVITASIDGVAVTNGVVTITQAGSAAGDLDVASPTAANVISAGQVLRLLVSGTNDAARTANGTIRLSY